MSKKIKPKCVYTGKPCPEKPFYVKDSIPLGNVLDRNPDGCNRWIEGGVLVQKGTPSQHVEQRGACLDIWNLFYLQNYAIAAEGNQKATESMRNGLCDTVTVVDEGGKKRTRYQPKISPLAGKLLEMINQQQAVIEAQREQNLLLTHRKS